MEPVRLAEVVGALSIATDIGLGQPIEQGILGCLLAVRLGRLLGLDDGVLADAYYLSTLRFIGCTADTRALNRYFGDELAVEPDLLRLDAGRPADMVGFIVRRVGAHRPPLARAGLVVSALARSKREIAEANAAHCQVAALLAGQLGFEGEVLRGIDQSFERWDGRGDPGRARGEALVPALRLAQVASTAALFWASDGIDGAVAAVRRRAGGALDPHLASAFGTAPDELVAGLGEGSAWDEMLDVEPGARPVLTGQRLDDALRACGQFADLKSPYTVGHSAGVAGLAGAAAGHLGLPADDGVRVRRAGWVHDLGRVGVSALVWERAGALARADRECVRLHPYYTERVLAPARGLGPIATVASYHHERLDGSGYHRAALAPSQPVLGRLLAAADVFHALTEPRPHRSARPPGEAAAVLRAEVVGGRLDGAAAEAVVAAAGQPRRRGGGPSAPAGLTAREVEVLRLLARGQSKRQIADRLVVSTKTADSHVQHIYTKLGVSTRAAAAVFAMRHGLLVD